MKIKVDGSQKSSTTARQRVVKFLSNLKDEEALTTKALRDQSGVSIDSLRTMRKNGFDMCVMWGYDLAWANSDTIKFMKSQGAK